MYEYHGVEIADLAGSQILDSFIRKCIDDDYPSRILLGNHLKAPNRRMTSSELESLCADEKPVILYHERLKKIYDANLPSVYEYLQQLEPWEDADLLIFDRTLQWYICVTHEDSILAHGL